MTRDSSFAGMSRRHCTVLLGSGLLAGTAGVTAAAPGEPDPRGFDFLHGRWRVTHRKLRRRLAGCSDWHCFPGTLAVAPILDGAGNFDRNTLADPAGSYEASSLRLFDPRTGDWSIWWLDGRRPAIELPVVGRFAGAKGTFFADDSFAGRPIRVRTTYEPLGRDRAQWTQAFSPDGGNNWEVNWIMDFMRDAG